MPLSLRRWRPKHLLRAWASYWLALALVVLGPPALAIWRMSRQADAHGNVSANFDDSLVTLSVVVDGATAWTGAATMPAITGWLVGPPLALWLLWLLLQRRSDRRDPTPVGTPAASRALGSPPPPTPPFDRRREAATVDRDGAA